MNKKELKKEIEELKDQITINEYYHPIKKQVELKQELSAKDLEIKNLNDYCRHIENESFKTNEKLKVQYSEMRRLNIIIDNYEVKLNITVREDK